MRNFLTLLLVLLAPIASEAKRPKIDDPKSIVDQVCNELNARKDHDLDQLKPACKQTPYDLLIAFVEEARNTPKSTSGKFRFLKSSIKDLKKTLIVHGNFPQPKPLVTVDPEFELSGFVFDHKRNLIWGIGDEENTLMKLDVATNKVENFEIIGIQNQNWEAITVDDKGTLWILDTGDNTDKRGHVAFIAFDINQAKDHKLKVEKTFLVKYDRKAVDVEGGFFHKGKVYLVERDNFETVDMMEVKLPDPKSAAHELEAKNFGLIPSGPSVTDVSMTADGRLFLLSFFDISELVNWDKPEKRERKIVEKLFVGQQEALAALSPSHFLVGTEGGKIFDIQPSTK
jgi:hypothetical protein